MKTKKPDSQKVESKKNQPLTTEEKNLLMETPQNAFSGTFPNHTRSFLVAEKIKLSKKISPESIIMNEMGKKKMKEIKSKDERLVKHLMEEVERLETEKQAIISLKENYQTFKIEPSKNAGGNEATAVALLSDWHIDEIVRSQQVNYLNRFDFDLAQKRATVTFQTIKRMIDILGRDIEIKTLVLALLGDFISGSIHDELKESNSMLPIFAIYKAQNLIASGIQFLLDNTNVDIVIPCCPGNHSRITEKQRISTEQGNSLETLAYMNLADKFAGEKRIKFVIAESYLVYVDVYGYTLRFHHGHAIKYGGGMGGIFIPAFKAISQWDKAKKADLTCFGHFHQMKDGGNFISNGSLIGYNSYAINIKADYEKPKQTFFLIDRKRGKTVTTPIVLNGD